MPRAEAPCLGGPSLRLLTARTLAWALLLGAWLSLGGLGRQWTPLVLGGVGPVALWLAVIGVALVAGRGRCIGTGGLSAMLVGSAGVLALALAWVPALGPAAVHLAAAAWALLLVAASRTVKGLRQALLSSGRRPGSPAVPAALGAALAWILAGDGLHLDPVVLGASALAAAVGLAGLSTFGVAARGCHSGLFDCALPFAGPADAAGRGPALVGATCARAVMLPMMITLPVMLELCSGSGLFSPQGVLGPRGATALHLACMVLPALVLQAGRVSAGRKRLATGLALAAMAAGGALVLLRPDAAGWMAGSLLQAAAWGLMWGAAVGSGAAQASGGPPTARATALPDGDARPMASTSAAGGLGRWARTAAQGGVPCAIALGLGLLVGAFGAPGAMAVQVLLAGVAAGTAGVAAWRHGVPRGSVQVA